MLVEDLCLEVPALSLDRWVSRRSLYPFSLSANFVKLVVDDIWNFRKLDG